MVQQANFKSRDNNGFENCQVVPAETNVEIADGNFLPVRGHGKVELVAQRSGKVAEFIVLNHVLHMPGLGA